MKFGFCIVSQVRTSTVYIYIYTILRRIDDAIVLFPILFYCKKENIKTTKTIQIRKFIFK